MESKPRGNGIPSVDASLHGSDADLIERFDVGIRIVYSLIFSMIVSMLQSITALIVLFQLVYSLITQTMPSERVQYFANRLVTYAYQILRYLTHNDSLIPFPFSDFPEPLEPSQAAYAPRSSESRTAGDEQREDSL